MARSATGSVRPRSSPAATPNRANVRELARISASTTPLAQLGAAVRRVARIVRRIAFAGLAGAAAIVALLARDGFSAGEIVLTLLLLAPAAIVLLFAQGIAELGALPDRLRNMPSQGGERMAELSRLAGEARSARMRNVPGLLWRLRGTVGGIRDVAGIALPLRVLAPGFLGLAALAALACICLVGVGLIALVVLAA